MGRVEDFAEDIWGCADYTRRRQCGMVICDGGRGQDAEMLTRLGAAVGVFFDIICAFVSPAQSSILESVATCALHDVRVGK